MDCHFTFVSLLLSGRIFDRHISKQVIDAGATDLFLSNIDHRKHFRLHVEWKIHEDTNRHEEVLCCFLLVRKEEFKRFYTVLAINYVCRNALVPFQDEFGCRFLANLTSRGVAQSENDGDGLGRSIPTNPSPPLQQRSRYPRSHFTLLRSLRQMPFHLNRSTCSKHPAPLIPKLSPASPANAPRSSVSVASQAHIRVSLWTTALSRWCSCSQMRRTHQPFARI